MKVLALIGSPRKDGNTAALVKQILKAVEAGDNTTEQLFLYDYTISLCTDCRTCKKGDYLCCVNDEMQEIYPRMEEADLIIFGTPLYWYGPSAKMKQLIDRMRPFVENGKLKGKKAAVVTPSGEGPKACGPMLEMFRLIFQYLGMEFAGKVFVKAYEKGEILNHPEELKRAYEFGRSLVS